ncbi:MAG: cupin domain-containing protein [Verrucomicrobia bacterium]|nr:cupin domain-containing protein [Verrucomicrobiota bacterium]
MSQSYLHHADLSSVLAPPESIVSRTLHSDAQSKIVLFAFAAGQELSEHTAAVPAIMHFLSGEADVKLGGETVRAVTNSWIRMEPDLPHAIHARTPVTMLLTMFKASGGGNPPRPASES